MEARVRLRDQWVDGFRRSMERPTYPPLVVRLRSWDQRYLRRRAAMAEIRFSFIGGRLWIAPDALRFAQGQDGFVHREFRRDEDVEIRTRFVPPVRRIIVQHRGDRRSGGVRCGTYVRRARRTMWDAGWAVDDVAGERPTDVWWAMCADRGRHAWFIVTTDAVRVERPWGGWEVRRDDVVALTGEAPGEVRLALRDGTSMVVPFPLGCRIREEASRLGWPVTPFGLYP